MKQLLFFSIFPSLSSDIIYFYRQYIEISTQQILPYYEYFQLEKNVFPFIINLQVNF